MDTINHIVYYPFSAFLYIAIVVSATYLSYVASNTPKVKTQRVARSITVLLLSLFSGFRSGSVGTDTWVYLRHISEWQGSLSGKYPTEPGLAFITKVFSLIVKDPQFILIVVAFIINFFILNTLWKFRDKASYSYAVFVYTSIYYVMTFSGIRQWLAVAIAFYSMKYLFELRYVRFSLFVILASLFHNSAILVLSLPLIDLISNKMQHRKQRIVFALIILLIPVAFGALFVLDNKTNLLKQYANYLINIRKGDGTGLIIWIKLLIAMLVYVCLKTEPPLDISFSRRIYKVYLLGLLVSLPGYFIPNMSRIGWYFNIFETIMFGIVATNGKKKMTFLVMAIITVFTTLLFLNELAGSGRGHVPYIPFWQ